MVNAYLAFLVLLALQRIGELVISRRHTRWAELLSTSSSITLLLCGAGISPSTSAEMSSWFMLAYLFSAQVMV